MLAYITAADGQGLADRTQRRFFSAGLLPTEAIVDRDTTAAEVMQDARASLPYAYPRLPHLELRSMGKREYVYALEGTGNPGGESATKPSRRRLLAYERVPGRVRFFLDRRVYDDSARVLLPEIGAYAAGLIDHLFRAEIHLEVQPGLVTVSLADAHGDVRGGEVRLFGQDAAGRRRQIATVPASATPVSAVVPAWARRIAAVLHGADDAGELVAVTETPAR